MDLSTPPSIHDNISLNQFVIPGLTRNPVRVWIPAFPRMTSVVATYDAMYNKWYRLIYKT